MATKEDLEKNFSYHPPLPGQTDRYRDTRAAAKLFAGVILELSNPSREQSLALTKIEEAMFWANAAIARNG